MSDEWSDEEHRRWRRMAHQIGELEHALFALWCGSVGVVGALLAALVGAPVAGLPLLFMAWLLGWNAFSAWRVYRRERMKGALS